jgi:hypothetical protein
MSDDKQNTITCQHCGRTYTIPAQTSKICECGRLLDPYETTQDKTQDEALLGVIGLCIKMRENGRSGNA